MCSSCLASNWIVRPAFDDLAEIGKGPTWATLPSLTVENMEDEDVPRTHTRTSKLKLQRHFGASCPEPAFLAGA